MDGDPSSYFFLNLSFTEFLSQFGFRLGLVVVFLICTAFMSACEIAFFSLSRTEVEDFRNREDTSARIVNDLLHTPRYLLATLLTAINLLNVGIILIFSLSLRELSVLNHWNEWSPYLLPLLEIGLITFVILFFGEITPKVYAVQKRTEIVSSTAFVIRFLRTVFYPISWLMINSTRFLDKRLPKEPGITSKEKIKMAIDLTSEADSPDEEKHILKGLVDFSSISVKTIMTVRVDVKNIDLSTPFSDLVLLINEFGFSRIPVFEDTPDQVKGILYVKDLLPLLSPHESNPDWKKLLRPALFVPETKKIDALLEEFREKRQHIAIVVDEFGGTAGIITLEDIIEEIFGEINDEFDSVELVYSKLSENEYVFDGKLPLHELYEITGTDPTHFEEAKGDKDSLAGLILEVYGKIPDKGDVIELYGFHFHIESVVNNRIKRVKMVLPKNHEELSTS